MNDRTETRESFDGFIGGAVYDVLARITGYGPAYYRRAVQALPVESGMVLADLGCGTGSLAIALAGRTGKSGRVVGIDIAEKQLARARLKVAGKNFPIELRLESIAKPALNDSSVDGITMSQVIHALPDEIRTAMISEAFRILKPGGFFGLIEWSRPRFGYSAFVWSLSLQSHKDSDNWRGTYPKFFSKVGFELISDRYIDSLNRCQIFIKPKAT